MAKPPTKASDAESTDVAVVEKTAVALVETTGYEGYEGSGFENQDKEDYSIPFINVLQALSPQVETLDGAKAGMIINSVTNDLTKGADGVVFVPCVTQHVYVEWRPKEQGGGIVATHQLDADVVVFCKERQEFGKFKTPTGMDLVETFYVYGVLVTENGGEQAVMAFTSTKIKKYKAWMTKARGIQIAIKNAAGQVVKRLNPPLFAHRYKVKTVKEKNIKGEFYNYDISFDGADAVSCRISPISDLFQSCVAMVNMVNEGKAKLDTKGQEDAAPDSSSSGGSAPGGDAGDVPF